MGYIAVDLGTTNIKVACYDNNLKELSSKSIKVQYIKNNGKIEFNPITYFQNVCNAIAMCSKLSFSSTKEKHQIILTGQAESLIVIDDSGNPVRNGISWMDMRSIVECEEISSSFDSKACYKITGQNSIIPTWPITKILWIKKNEPDIFNANIKYMLLKDYIVFCLTGMLVGEYSIYNFSYYFDIINKCYWTEILDYCGVKTSQLPELVEPCIIIGNIKHDIANKLNLSDKCTVNIGTLDHFAGMIGTGNIREGLINESTGTVLSIATMLKEPRLNHFRIPCHYGPFKNSYVMMPICESGGISLEWYRDNFVSDEKYEDINNIIIKRLPDEQLIFLPYITGVNAPEFNKSATGVFYGVKITHDKYDFVYAVMEGIAHLLAKNIDFIKKVGVESDSIISTGGGAKSDFWSQLKANITGIPVLVPEKEEAASYGAAIIGSISNGMFYNYNEAISHCVSIKKKFYPKNIDFFAEKHKLFNSVYDRLNNT
ncbi:MAG: FGGY family carbohydrate kinase [Clostridia bacterium]|nr:FGGY family carbohydrate kinase [Clostridia bacterium]